MLGDDGRERVPTHVRRERVRQRERDLMHTLVPRVKAKRTASYGCRVLNKVWITPVRTSCSASVHKRNI